MNGCYLIDTMTLDDTIVKENLKKKNRRIS